MHVELLHSTENPARLMESVAGISYVTQRFEEKKRPASVKFSSGRILPCSQIKNMHLVKVGEPLLGYTKDDGVVEEIIPDSADTVVRFLKKIGHYVPFEMCNATFKITGMSRKSALHLNRYRNISTNMRSQKYLNQSQFEYVLPSKASNATKEEIIRYKEFMAEIQRMHDVLRDDFKWDPEDARLVLPNATEQQEVFHTNFRQMRHLFDILCDEGYVMEMHELGMEMLRLLDEAAPVFFEDYELKDGEFYQSAKRNKCVGCNVKVNWTLGDADKEKLNLKEH